MASINGNACLRDRKGAGDRTVAAALKKIAGKARCVGGRAIPTHGKLDKAKR